MPVPPGELKGESVAAGPPPDALAALARHGIARSFARGEFLFHAGDPPRGLFLVLEGRVRVVNERDGRRHLVHEEGAGATLGEVPLFLGGGYPASAVAATPARCLILSGANLRAAVTASPEVAWLLLTRLSARIRTLVERLTQVAVTPVRQALASLILERAHGGSPVALAATQQELAESLGTVREVIARQLTSLRRSGAIRSAGRGRIAIADRRQLLAISRNESM